MNGVSLSGNAPQIESATHSNGSPSASPGERSWNFSGELLVRYEDWDWFGSNANSYSYEFARARLNGSVTWKGIEVFLQPQFVYMANVPDDASLSAFQGPSGMGALYYIHNQDSTIESFGLHQAWLKVSPLVDTDLSLKIGRFTYASGLEHLRAQDGKKFNMLKTLRLGDRLISSFEWSAFARAFDGLQIDYERNDDIEITASLTCPTQGGWEKDFNESLDQVRISSLVVTLPKDRYITGTESSVFMYKYEDERSCTQRIDNTGSNTATAVDIDINLIGAHSIGIHKLGQGQLDHLLWGTYQWGKWYGQDHRAYAITAEAGYQWIHAPLKPWFRMGYFYGSGDDDPGDHRHETFFQMAPGTRKYQLFPYYDLQNIEYVFAQLYLFINTELKIRLDYSWNHLAESNDRWYMGTGATQDSGQIFGYLGRPSNGDTDLSNEASVMFIYEPTSFMSCNLFYSHVWGGDVIEHIYPDKADANYLSLEVAFNF